MNRKGFTLMELLLVVAVLAIVAAAAAPTFFNGSQEALKEAKKASFLSAYQNALSGANMYVALEVAKGNFVSQDNLAKNINTYAPPSTRAFNLQLSGNTNAHLVGYLVPFMNSNNIYVGYNNDAAANVAMNQYAVDPINSNMNYDQLYDYLKNKIAKSGTGS